MARRILDIQQQTIQTLKADPNTPVDLSVSVAAKWLSWTHLTATMIGMFEQILDVFTANIEAKVNRAGVGSSPWLLDRVKEFQFGNAVIYDPITGTWSYPLPAGAMIITRCAIVRGDNKVVYVKVATNDPPQQLNTVSPNDQYTALNTYINKIGIAGVQYSIINLASDKISVSGDVKYDGQYASSITIAVPAAINTLFQKLSDDINFGADISVIDIITTIKNVPGVKDFLLTKIVARADSVSYASAIPLYELAKGTNNLKFSPQSGYVVAETTLLYTLTDTLTYHPVI